MLGVVLSPRRTTRTGSFVAAALVAVACVPLSDLDSAAAGSPEPSTTGGAPPTGGEAGTAATTTGGVTPTGGMAASGGTGGIVPSGGTGGVEPTGGSGSVNPSGGAGGVEPNGGYAGVDGGHGGALPSGGAGGVPTGGTGGVEPSGGDGGVAGTAGGTGSTSGTGGLQCVGDLQDCDLDPSDCETDVTNNLNHCGACDAPCTGQYEECIDSQCVEPCTAETAFILTEPNVDYVVPGDGCVQVTDHLAGFYQFLGSREIPFTYVAEACDDEGAGTIPANQGSEPITACPMVLDLLSTGSDVVIRWWNVG